MYRNPKLLQDATPKWCVVYLPSSSDHASKAGPVKQPFEAIPHKKLDLLAKALEREWLAIIAFMDEVNV